jgi:hypothetical protein
MPTAEALAYRAFRLLELPETRDASALISNHASADLARISLAGT